MRQSPPHQASYTPVQSTALLLLADGTCYRGIGFGARGVRVGELCFNTSMTGYQEIITDPSYAGQIINFTFPHIGIVGCNSKDTESFIPAALGVVVASLPTPPSNYRAESGLSAWLKKMKLPAIAGIDTRALTQRIRDKGPPKALIAHDPSGQFAEGEFKREALTAQLMASPEMAGRELAKSVSVKTPEAWHQGAWDDTQNRYAQNNTPNNNKNEALLHVIAIDYGCKHNILRLLTSHGCRITYVPADTSAEAIQALNPDGVFLSNGPGDPAATAQYGSETIRLLAEAHIPIFGICIGHQLLAEAFGGATYKMTRGHRGGNHPVKRLSDGQIEITCQNHGFAVEKDSLPDALAITHLSLFDDSIEGLRHRHLPVFSVQYHPESSPGPHDSRYLFADFAKLMRQHKTTSAKNKAHATPH